MINKLRSLRNSKQFPLWVYAIGVFLLLFSLFYARIAGASYLPAYFLMGALILFACRPGSAVHSAVLANSDLSKILFTAVLTVITIATCVLPMDRLPLWNGEQPDHRNQYELMAEAILDGRIHFDYGDEDTLASLKNPYDPDERAEAGVYYHWDHAYYKGKYYMYFGVVPVFLAFLPYRVITGTALTTYHATQLFCAVSIIGIFVLFHLLSKLFFKRMSYGVYWALSVAFSVMSVWYATAEPALYCTAITAAIMLEIWSIYFFIRAVWKETKENRQILFAGIGALLGALAFGCRPPIALANIVVLPILIVFLKQRKFSVKLLGKLALAAAPYVVVAVLLMTYNYVRFEDPFEFGQAYQLTVADQTNYSVTLDAETLIRLLNETVNNFISRVGFTKDFPYMDAWSVLTNFPILLLCLGVFSAPVRRQLKEKKLTGLLIGLFAAVLVINVMDILWTPYLLERYRMDIYFLLGIACFIIVGLWQEDLTERRRRQFSTALVACAIVTCVTSFLLYVRIVGVYYPEQISQIANSLHIGQ